MTGNSATGLDHLTHALPPTGSKVEMEPLAWLQFFEGPQVSIREILDMNVVPNACPIGSGVVIAEDHDFIALSQGNLQDDRNQMGFRIVILSQIPSGAAPAALK